MANDQDDKTPHLTAATVLSPLDCASKVLQDAYPQRDIVSCHTYAMALVTEKVPFLNDIDRKAIAAFHRRKFELRETPE